MIRVLFWSAYSAFISGSCVHIWMTWRLMRVQDQLVDARGRALYAEACADQLLSGGRFIRTYDPKLGKNTYKFKPPARHMERIVVDVTTPVKEDFFETVLDWSIEALGEASDAVRCGEKSPGAACVCFYSSDAISSNTGMATHRQLMSSPG